MAAIFIYEHQGKKCDCKSKEFETVRTTIENWFFAANFKIVSRPSKKKNFSAQVSNLNKPRTD